MGFQITQVGLHDSSAGVVQVQHIEGRWAFGVFGERPMVWCSDNGKPIYGWDEAITGVHVEPKPAPFRISDHGCGIYETRAGREATVDEGGKPEHGEQFCWQGWIGSVRPSWRDDGTWAISRTPATQDLVRYIGPLPKPAETWTPTARFQDRVLNRDAGGPIPDGAFWSYRGGESKLVVREQCWVCGDREEWRVPEVCVCGDTEVSRG